MTPDFDPEIRIFPCEGQLGQLRVLIQDLCDSISQVTRIGMLMMFPPGDPFLSLPIGFSPDPYRLNVSTEGKINSDGFEEKASRTHSKCACCRAFRGSFILLA
jgi:hypothetical protein